MKALRAWLLLGEKGMHDMGTTCTCTVLVRLGARFWSYLAEKMLRA